MNKGFIFIFLQRGWSALIGFISSLAIINFLDIRQQGYYYTILSIGAFQALLELGVGQVILNYIATIRAVNKLDIEDSNLNFHEEIFQVLLYYRKWYSVVAFLFFIFSISYGFLLLSSNSEVEMNIWIAPFFAYCFFTALIIRYIPLASIYEGFGKIELISKLRIFQSILGNLLMIVILISYSSIWCVVAVPITSFLILEYFFNYHQLYFRKLNYQIKTYKKRFAVDKLILKFKFKMALSWVFGFFIYNLNLPAIFNQYGSILAGQYGLTINIINTMVMISLSMVASDAPNLTGLIATNNLNLFRTRVNRLMQYSIFIYGLICFVVILSLYFMGNHFGKIASRFLETDLLILVLVNYLCILVVSVYSIVLRSFRDEPTLHITILMGLISLLVILNIHYFTLHELFGITIFVNIFINLPLVFLKYRQFVRNN